MRRAILPALAAIALAPAASSRAQDEAAPSRKPGWWEMRMAISGPTPEPIHQTMHICTDAAFDKQQSPLGVDMRGNGCAPTRIARTATGWTVAGACDTGQMKITADAVATGDLNARYHVDIVTRMNPPPTPQAAVVKVGMDARWIGACPAGKKPGDIDTTTSPSPQSPAAN
jgi:hypothetical protein